MQESATQALEQTLEECLQSLLEMGICASDVHPRAMEDFEGGAASGYPGGLVGKKAAQTIEHLARLHSLKDSVGNILIPLEVINSVDAGKNPHTFTRDLVERVAGENMYTNGIISAVTDYRELLNTELLQAFPELAQYLPSKDSPPAEETEQNGSGGGGGGSGGARMDES
ncbi:hypothetical protein RQP46_000749 [Phenoliferia psychrophenolica]